MALVLPYKVFTIGAKAVFLWLVIERKRKRTTFSAEQRRKPPDFFGKIAEQAQNGAERKIGEKMSTKMSTKKAHIGDVA